MPERDKQAQCEGKTTPERGYAKGSGVAFRSEEACEVRSAQGLVARGRTDSRVSDLMGR